MDKLFVHAMSNEIVNLTDKYEEQIRDLTSTLNVYKSVLHYPLYTETTVCLIINIIDRGEIYNPFAMLTYEERWVYAVSDNKSILESFKNRIISYTPEKYRQLLDISIVELNMLSRDEVKNNFNPDYIKQEFKINCLYFESIVNRPGTDMWTLDEFTQDKWAFDWERMDETD